MQISWDILFRSFRERLPDQNYLQGREVVSASEDGGAAYLTFSDGITVGARPRDWRRRGRVGCAQGSGG
jgi:hypothetical protein